MRTAPPSALLVALALLFLASTIHAEEEAVADYLVTVTASRGASLTPIPESNCFTLALAGADHLVWFTDRPEREAHSSHAKLLTENWEKAFATSAPNADLEMFGEKGILGSVVLTLEAPPQWDDDTQTMTFTEACAIDLEGELPEEHAVGKAATEAPYAALFIDGAKLFHWNACTKKLVGFQSALAGGILGDGLGQDELFPPSPFICQEQWGSYPIHCGRDSPSFQWYEYMSVTPGGPVGGGKASYQPLKPEPGKRCHDFCEGQDYDSHYSWKEGASTYHCSSVSQ